MSSTRIWVEHPNEEKITVDGMEYNHLANVLRVKVGDDIIVISGDEFDRLYVVSVITKKNIDLAFISKIKNDRNPDKKFTVYLAAIKPEPLSWAVQKLNEIGVMELKIFISQFTALSERQLNISRLNEICKQSCKQCGRSIPMHVKFIKNIFEEDLSNTAFLDEKSDHAACRNDFDSIIVGPEGGFSDKERFELSKSAVSISLGKRILRAETAAVVGASKWCI